MNQMGIGASRSFMFFEFYDTRTREKLAEYI